MQAAYKRPALLLQYFPNTRKDHFKQVGTSA